MLSAVAELNAGEPSCRLTIDPSACMNALYFARRVLRAADDIAAIVDAEADTLRAAQRAEVEHPDVGDAVLV